MNRTVDHSEYARENLQRIRVLGKGKSGISTLAESSRGRVVLKEMHNEQQEYYHFAESKVSLELASYETLRGFSLRLPALLYYSREENYLVKEYIAGPTAGEVLSSLPEGVLPELYVWSEELRRAGVNIDYFPSNFVIADGLLYYIDYEHNPYDPCWGFADWGSWYWIHPEGFARFLESGDGDCINQAGQPLPIKTPELEQRHEALLQRCRSLSREG